MSALISLETLARAKGLQPETLRGFGVSDRRDGGVRVEYLAPDGAPVRARVRLAMGGLDGSRWEEGDAPIAAYWRPLVGDLVGRRGMLLVCEGESSCWTAWQAGFGAVGIPGADRIDALHREHVARAPTVVVVVEPEDPQTYPQGRERYRAEVVGRLGAVGYAGRITMLDLAGVAADLNELYRADPGTFAARLAALVERAAQEDEIDRAIARSRRLVGCAAPDVPRGVDVASWLNVNRFAEASGDENPLYTDVGYGARSIHCTMLAPPGFVLAVLTPDSAGALDAEPHHLVDAVSALQLVWDDNVRLGDRLRGRAWIGDVARHADPGGTPSARVTTNVAYEREGVPFARGHCEVTLQPMREAERLEQPIQHYGAEEIAGLEARLDEEPPPRGDRPRFWSKTAVGEQLPALLKGPLTFSDLLVWKVAQGRPMRAGNLHHGDLAALDGRRTTNPLTGWPAWDRLEAWDDSATSGVAGLRAPAARGGLLFALAGQLVSHWMGDDAFLRRLGVRISQPLFYGDVLTLRGVVVDRFAAEDEASQRYHAVTVEVSGCNQLEEPVLAGEAVVLLSDPGKPVRLPVSGELSCDPPGGG